MTSAAIHQCKQPVQPALTKEARVSAGLSAIGLAAVFAGLGVRPNADWVEPMGALVHLAMLPLVSNLPAPIWGRAMGYAWLALDTAVSIMLINGVEYPLAMALRLGAHVLAAVWIGSSSWPKRGLSRWLGIGTAAAIGSHSFIAPYTGSPGLLAVAGPLILLWLLVLAFTVPRVTPAPSESEHQ